MSCLVALLALSTPLSFAESQTEKISRYPVPEINDWSEDLRGGVLVLRDSNSPKVVDLSQMGACCRPLSGEAGRPAFRTQGGAALTLGSSLQPFQGKKPPPKGV